MKKNIISLLNERNLIFQITKKEKLINHIIKKSINLYCGFDPNYDSLHIGHLIPIICIKKFLKYNHNSIIVIGGSTSLIGDPSFKNKEIKKIYNKNIINEWTNKISNQILNIFNINNKNILILNNNNWLNSINLIDFLQDIGKNVKINTILNKESIKFRMKNNTLSFKEFSYNVLQSYDFLHLYKKHNVTLQIGGSDQWGNITSGINLIKKIYNKSVYGITLPILTDLKGNKFGKSNNENSVIWLDKKKTSPYKFYQFWINISDNDVFKYLKYFTNISIENINYLYNEKNYKNYLNCKKIIAKYLTKMIHGKQGLLEALRITENLFSKNIFKLDKKDFDQLYNDKLNNFSINKKTSLQELLINIKIVDSKNKANNIINQGSIKINGKIQNNIKYYLCDKDILYKKYTLLSKGKKNFYLIKWNN